MNPATTHKLYFRDARHMSALPDHSVHLVVTSPPYPMIALWDGVFAALDPEIAAALAAGEGAAAFERMHRLLQPVWRECVRVLVPGGILCLNIGDATRKIGGEFRLFSNHSRTLQDCLALGLDNLPNIIWRKPANAPNKFMGSGMLPPGAYVTLEHEYILIFRKGSPRRFTTPPERQQRRESAYFWEERNAWFSDVWFDLKGEGQPLNHRGLRERSGAFPFELPYRLIHMFSVRDDTVLDPFAGTGTTLLAAMAARRHSVGYELNPGFGAYFAARAEKAPARANRRIRERLAQHRRFVQERHRQGHLLKYRNIAHDLPCVSRQEQHLRLPLLTRVRPCGENTWCAEYEDIS